MKKASYQRIPSEFNTVSDISGIFNITQSVTTAMDRRRGSRIGLNLHRIGNSAGPVIPAEWRDHFDLEPGEDLVDAEADFEEETITYHL